MTMKNLKLIYTLLPIFIFGVLLSSCQKEEEITEEELVETIEVTLKSSEGGAAKGGEEMAEMLLPYKSSTACGSSRDTTISRSTSNWNRTLNWNRKVNCDANNVYSNVVFTRNGTATYNGTRLAMNATLTGSATATQLDASFDNYLMNGSFNRQASATYTGPRRTKSYTTDITHTWVDVELEKGTRQIVGGTGAISISGTVDNGNSFSRTGSIVYNGDGTATLTMTNGNIYTINVR